VISFAASDTKAVRRVHLSARHLREIAAIERVSSAEQRARLIVSLPNGTDARGIVLLYGVARYPDGRVPSEVAGDAPAFDAAGKPIYIRESFHAIGAGCNVFYAAWRGSFLATTGPGCETWRPSAADRIAARYGLPAGNDNP
jgi:hypothetical protein